MSQLILLTLGTVLSHKPKRLSHMYLPTAPSGPKQLQLFSVKEDYRDGERAENYGNEENRRKYIEKYNQKKRNNAHLCRGDGLREPQRE